MNVIVVGGGKVGYYLAETLLEHGHKPFVIETDKEICRKIANNLDIPVISYAQNLKVEGDSVIVERQYDDRYHVLKAKMPCLVTALAELNEPRYMTPGGIFDAYDAEITVWGRKDLKDVDDSNLGLKGSPTQIAKASDKVRKGAGEKVALDPAESVDYIMDKLLTKHVI